METIILPIHILSLAYIAWNVAMADHMGFTWIEGSVSLLDEKKVKKYHYSTLLGLVLIIITGFMLFWPMREFLLTRTQFYIKMGFVLALIINSFVIGILSKTSTTKTFASLTTKEKIPLFISGAVSTLSWLGAILMAFFLIPD
jgi:uncharacterized membrane protein